VSRASFTQMAPKGISVALTLAVTLLVSRVAHASLRGSSHDPLDGSLLEGLNLRRDCPIRNPHCNETKRFGGVIAAHQKHRRRAGPWRGCSRLGRAIPQDVEDSALSRPGACSTPMWRLTRRVLSAQAADSLSALSRALPWRRSRLLDFRRFGGGSE
jgi:hypothetical protein